MYILRYSIIYNPTNLLSISHDLVTKVHVHYSDGGEASTIGAQCLVCQQAIVFVNI